MAITQHVYRYIVNRSTLVRYTRLFFFLLNSNVIRLSTAKDLIGSSEQYDNTRNRAHFEGYES